MWGGVRRASFCFSLSPTATHACMAHLAPHNAGVGEVGGRSTLLCRSRGRADAKCAKWRDWKKKTRSAAESNINRLPSLPSLPTHQLTRCWRQATWRPRRRRRWRLRGVKREGKVCVSVLVKGTRHPQTRLSDSPPSMARPAQCDSDSVGGGGGGRAVVITHTHPPCQRGGKSRRVIAAGRPNAASLSHSPDPAATASTTTAASRAGRAMCWIGRRVLCARCEQRCEKLLRE